MGGWATGTLATELAKLGQLLLGRGRQLHDGLCEPQIEPGVGLNLLHAHSGLQGVQAHPAGVLVEPEESQIGDHRHGLTAHKSSLATRLWTAEIPRARDEVNRLDKPSSLVT